MMDMGLVRQRDIDEEMRESYLSYAMSVIVSRALPDARDGLKPVQRRILYAMRDMGIGPSKSHKKSARVVGEVLGKYHPHGDQSVYDAMVRMAQDFSLRYPLVDGQGNFGSVDGDGAAAMRYTEARVSMLGYDLLNDLEKETVDFGPNFDDSLTEPLVLPADIPNFLVNGATGIAVGMSTSVPPHNLGEVVNALVYMLDNWKKVDNIALDELMQFIKGPDFPTGGMLFSQRKEKDGSNNNVLAKAYGSGRGKVTVRGRAHIEQMERNKSRIVITELPYQVNKTNLMTRIADLHRDSKLEGLTDMRDESDRNGMRIVLETTRNIKPKDLLAQLFKLTPLQTTFSIIMVALVKGEPRVLTLKQSLKVFLDHRQEIVKRRSEYDLRRAKERAHILEGLLIALDNLDAVIATIRKSRNTETARANLIKQFKLSEIQARAILEMQLRRLAALERNKIRDEYKAVLKTIKQFEKLLSKPALIRTVVKEELLALIDQYNDGRRTQIVDEDESDVVTVSDMVPDAQCWVMTTEEGTVARTRDATMLPIPGRPKQLPTSVLEANERDTVYLVAANGTAVSLPVYQLPVASTFGEGTSWTGLTAVSGDTLLSDAFIVPADDGGGDAIGGYLTMATLGGAVKRVKLNDLPGVTTDPFTIIRVGDDDSLGWASVSSGEDEILLATANGQLIRFDEVDVRTMGLKAGGVAGIKLKDDLDGVIGMQIVSQAQLNNKKKVALVWSITDNGLAKATPIAEYPKQKRHGRGVVNVKLADAAEEVVAMIVGIGYTELYVKSAIGTAKRMRIARADEGGRAMKLKSVLPISERNRVTGVVRTSERPDLPEAPPPKQMALIE